MIDTQSILENSVPLGISNPVKQYNTTADWIFYDTGALTQKECDFLIHETTIEGAILVVHPSGSNMGVLKYSDFDKLCAGKGKLLQRFSIAGVGSSDVGAAALARTLADYYQEPVGAIVAGYGVADLLTEALGGWFVLGSANRMMAYINDYLDKPDYNGTLKLTNDNNLIDLSPDSKTLLNLLLDTKREIKSLGGHSKGCLSIAYALEALTNSGNKDAFKKAKQINIITAGAVIELPKGFNRVTQFIGSIDWFGGMNSRHDVDKITVPNAWHHLNTEFPLHMDLQSEMSAHNVV